MKSLRLSHDSAIRTATLRCRQAHYKPSTLLSLPFLRPSTWQPQGQHAASPFSSTTALMKRKPTVVRRDRRITNIRYHLSHYKVPRPLRFSRLRALRHWTIHRAWQLYQHKRRKDHELELERLYNSMSDACETLRLMDDYENMGREEGRLYRAAMQKQGVWSNVPIEYTKCQTDYPSKEGWDHDWIRR